MAKRLPEDYSIEIKEPTVSELILKFMFEIDKHLTDFEISITESTFGITGTFKGSTYSEDDELKVNKLKQHRSNRDRKY